MARATLKEAKRPHSSLPYDLEEPEDESEITRALMKLSERALSKHADGEPDLYK
jgi:hypothetical protein